MDMEAVDLNAAAPASVFGNGRRAYRNDNSASNCASEGGAANALRHPRGRIWWGDIVPPLSLSAGRTPAADLSRNGNPKLGENGYLFG
jgi:hypothetical protein